jgi:hypothetical protein
MTIEKRDALLSAFPGLGIKAISAGRYKVRGELQESVSQTHARCSLPSYLPLRCAQPARI